MDFKNSNKYIVALIENPFNKSVIGLKKDRLGNITSYFIHIQTNKDVIEKHPILVEELAYFERIIKEEDRVRAKRRNAENTRRKVREDLQIEKPRQLPGEDISANVLDIEEDIPLSNDI